MSDLIEQIKADREAGTPGEWVDQELRDRVFVGPMKSEIASLSRVVAALDVGPDYCEKYVAIQRTNARRIARVPQLEQFAIDAAAEIQRLTEERDEADRRAGAAERTLGAELEDLRDTARKRAEWLRKAKKRAGYEDHVSFDKVFADLLIIAEENKKLRAALKGGEA